MQEKLNFRDVSYLIHFSYDVPERLRNLKLVVDFYNKHTDDMQFVVAWERDIKDPPPPSVGLELENLENVKLIQYESDPNVGAYHRTRGFNLAYLNQMRPAVILGDTDCIINPKALRESVDVVKEESGVCVCHNGTFIELMEDGLPFKIFQEDLDISHFEELQYPNQQFYRTNDFGVRQLNCLGGAVAVSMDYYDMVPECEHFIGWGYEDDHRVKLAHRLGYMATKHNVGVFYHLPHESTKRVPDKFFETRNERINSFMESLTDEQLRGYIATWAKYKLSTI